MVTAKKPAGKAAKKAVKHAAKKAGKKGPAGGSPAKKAAAKSGSKVKSRTEKVNVGRLDLLWRELERLAADMRSQGLTDFANSVGAAQDVVKRVYQDLIGGKGNGPDPGKMISVSRQ